MDTVKIDQPMPEPNKCPQCGTPLPSGALAGLCPACLLKMGAAADTVTDAKSPPFNPPSVAELAPLFPQLEILELIGKGGMGAVYKARQKQLDRIVAVKILPPGIGHDAAFAERFTREAKALAKLNHPNIVTLYEFGEASGQFYFLMEFVDGVNLRQLLNASRISSREALAIVPQICDALQFAHDQGIVHRDIKPENILLDRRGRVKVADFGLAKIIEGRDDTNFSAREKTCENLTDAGKTMGTPNYMSPEQKENPGDVDHRADIYALGVVFYQMLTGELPGKKIEAPSRKVQIDVRLDEIVLRALEKNPALRYQQVSEVKTRVETIAASPGNPPPLAQNVHARKTGRPFAFALLLALLGFAGVVVVSIIYANILPVSFAATARVKIDRVIPANEIPLTYPNYAITPYDPYALQTQCEVIESEKVLDSVISRLGLYGAWSKKHFNGQQLPAAETMELLRKRMQIQPVKNTSLIDIACYSDSATEAAGIANAVAESYRDYSRDLVHDFTKSPDRKPSGQPASPKPLLYQVQITDTAQPPLRPVRPNKTVIVAVGIIAGLFFGAAIFALKLFGPYFRQKSFAPKTGKPDHFWRWFAVAVFALISIPILISIIGLLAAIAIPNFVKARARAQENTRLTAQNLSANLTADFYIGQTNFPKGDSIEITSVDRNENQMTVKGHYNLVSADEASLWLNITATNNDEVPNQAEPPQSIHISKGSGDFELSRSHLVPGLPHVSMHDNHHPFADIYFGTKDEAVEENKLNLNDDQSQVDEIKFGPVIERAMVDSKSNFQNETDRTTAPIMIDFDSGLIVAGSSAMWNADTSSQKKWMQTNGVDALAVIPQVNGLVGLDMKIVSMPQAWNGLSAVGATKILAQTKSKDTVLITADELLPCTWLFQTREGSAGILQITGFTQNPRGVKIRYKLVQNIQNKILPTLDEVARLEQQIADNKLEIAKKKFQSEVISQAGKNISASNIVSVMKLAYATIWTYRDAGSTIFENGNNDDVWTNKFSELLDRRNCYRSEVVTAAHPFSQTNRWWADGNEECWQQGSSIIFTNSNPASSSGNISLMSNDSTIPALFFHLNWGNIIDTLSFSSATELIRQKDEIVSGIDCYVLQQTNHGMTVWIGKQDFLIRRYRLFISKTAAAEAMKHSPNPNTNSVPAQIINTETHENIIVNESLSKDDFSP